MKKDESRFTLKFLTTTLKLVGKALTHRENDSRNVDIFESILSKELEGLPEVACVIRGVLTAANERVAKELLNEAIRLFKNDMPKLATWLEENLMEGFTHFQFPETHYRQLRTSDMLERVNKEIRRRTRVVGVFPNTESCERLISAVLFEINDEWQAGKRYVIF